MSAEVLRRAASLMRERAEAAHQYPEWCWQAERSRTRLGVETTSVFIAEAQESVFEDEYCSLADAIHIASWHPAVALAVADWLDACAAFEQKLNGGEGKGPSKPEQRWQPHQFKQALAVARAYLGLGESP